MLNRPQLDTAVFCRVCPQIVTTHVNRCTGHSAWLEFPKFPATALTRSDYAAWGTRKAFKRRSVNLTRWNLRPVGSAWGSSLEAVGASNACTSRAPISRTSREQRTEPRLRRCDTHSLDHDEFSLSRSSTSLPGSLLPRLRSFAGPDASEAQGPPSSPARTLVRGILGRVATKESKSVSYNASDGMHAARGGSLETASLRYVANTVSQSDSLASAPIGLSTSPLRSASAWEMCGRHSAAAPEIAENNHIAVLWPAFKIRVPAHKVFPRAHFGSQLSPESGRTGALNHSARMF